MEEFLKSMNKKSDEQLLFIIQYEKNKYNPKAIEAAKEVLKSRNLHKDEIARINQNLEDKIELKEEKRKNVENILNQGSSGLNSTLDSIHPLTPKSDKTILNIICAYLSYLLVRLLYSNYYTLLPKYFSFSSIETLFSVIILLISIYGLFTRKRYGWMSVIVFLSYQFITNLCFFVLYTWEALKQKKSRKEYTQETDSDLLDFMETYGLHYDFGTMAGKALGSLLIISGIIWYLNKSNTVTFFNISSEEQKKSFVIGISLGVLVCGLMFLVL